MTDANQKVIVEGVRLVDLTRIVDANGSLIVADSPSGLPFAAKRIFSLFDIPANTARGIHAHRQCQQFLICMRGSVRAIVDDGLNRQEFRLDAAALGLYMPAMIWGTQFDYSHDALLVVLASEPYDKADYIEDYDEFVELRKNL